MVPIVMVITVVIPMLTVVMVAVVVTAVIPMIVVGRAWLGVVTAAMRIFDDAGGKQWHQSDGSSKGKKFHNKSYVPGFKAEGFFAEEA